MSEHTGSLHGFVVLQEQAPVVEPPVTDPVTAAEVAELAPLVEVEEVAELAPLVEVEVEEVEELALVEVEELALVEVETPEDVAETLNRS